MDNSIFYKSVECIVTNEGKNLFAKQANGVKFSKVGAVLFSDLRGTIKDAYNRGLTTNNSFLKKSTLLQLRGITREQAANPVKQHRCLFLKRRKTNLISSTI